jgi:hypothetical protein
MTHLTSYYFTARGTVKKIKQKKYNKIIDLGASTSEDTSSSKKTHSLRKLSPERICKFYLHVLVDVKAMILKTKIETELKILICKDETLVICVVETVKMLSCSYTSTD